MYITLFISDGRGMGHPRCHTLYCQPRTQIRSLDRKPLTVALTGNYMGRRLVYYQCITDMPCMTLGESLSVFRCCNDADHRGCYRGDVRESDDDTEGVGLSLSV